MIFFKEVFTVSDVRNHSGKTFEPSKNILPILNNVCGICFISKRYRKDEGRTYQPEKIRDALRRKLKGRAVRICENQKRITLSQKVVNRNGIRKSNDENTSRATQAKNGEGGSSARGINISAGFLKNIKPVDRGYRSNPHVPALGPESLKKCPKFSSNT